MIPYDDLVAALASWRARQGLPTEQLSGAASAPKAAVPAAAPAAKSGPAARPAARNAKPARAASPAFGHEDSFDVEESALLVEASYDSDFGEYGGGEPGEATAIGTPPAPPRRGGR